MFNSPYTVWFALAFLLINFFSYNGGTWNLATRFISARDPVEAKKTSILSGILYLVWPLILFFPMWVSPLLFPDIENPETVYGLLTMELLPHGLIGLVLASLFANTMSMTSSDANTISAVINRDILPTLSVRFRELSRSRALVQARITTFLFILGTLIIGIFADSFGGILGLIINWFGAFIGVIAVPMILGLLPFFRTCSSRGAIFSMIAGTLTFILAKLFISTEMIASGAIFKTIEIGSPVLVTLLVYTVSAVLGSGLSNNSNDA
jgi:Na+/proline symporter